MLVRETVIAEPDDVDELHVEALPSRGHAHELTLVRSGHPHPRDDLVAVHQDVLGVHAQTGWYVGEVAEAPDRQELLTALTTEHFTLQGARSQTASESASRASLYILSVSSTLVALGFIGQASQVGTTFDVFALTVLPTLYVLGVFTFVRVVECGAEDFRYGVAINRIRNYYKQIAGDQAKLFLLSGHDDGRGVFENAAVPPERRKQFFTFATVVAVVNSVVGGSAIAIALGAIADASLGVAAGVGGVAALVSLVALLRYADRLLEERAGRTESIFPSPRDG